MALSGVALARGALVTLVVMPRFRRGPSDLEMRYGYLGRGVGGILVGLVAHPEHALSHLWMPAVGLTVLALVSSVGWLPLLAPRHALAAVPLLLFHLLSTPPQMTLQYHYSLELLPLVWIAALHGLMHAPSWVRRPSGSVGCIGRLPRQSAISIPRTVGSLGILPDRWRWQPEYGSVLWLALCGVIAFAIASPFPPARLFMPKRFVDTPAHTRAVTPALALIPPDAAVSAQTGLASHLSHREHLAQFPDLNGAQYVLLDASDDVARSEPEAQAAAMSALPVQGYRLIYSANGVAVYEKVPDR